MYTDTHCHIYKEYYDDINGVIERAKKVCVKKMIVNGTNLASNKEILALAKEYGEIYAALGYHPEDIESFKEEHLSLIKENIDSIVAIGEIGLDYHYEPCDKEAQKDLFRKQLDIASKYNKPVIVHSRDATEDTIKILKEFPHVHGSIHCFSGSLETAKIYISLGYKLGIGGVLTFKNAHLKELLHQLPLENFLLETDSPYLSPEPFRGQQNEPANVFTIVEFISREINVTKEEISTITEKSVNAIFDI